jgi:hypothetical protein
MHKSYKVSTNCEEPPYHLMSKPERMPKIMSKLTPQDLFFAEVEDLADKSSIFREFKAAKTLESDPSVSSHLIPDTFSQVDVVINDLDANK